MTEVEPKLTVLAVDQKLREIWFDTRDAHIIKNQIADAYAEFSFALNSEFRFEAPALAILGGSGRGKLPASSKHWLASASHQHCRVTPSGLLLIAD